MQVEKLQTLEFDVEKNIYRINGRDISSSCHEVNLSFENGTWSLLISEKRLYTTSDLPIKE